MTVKVKIFGEEKQEKRVLLKLSHGHVGKDTVSVIAVDDNGVIVKSGLIMTIGVNGVTVHTHLNTDLGFALDSKGSINVRKEGE